MPNPETDEWEKCEICEAEWRRGTNHPPGIQGVTRPCPRAENTRPRSEAGLRIEEYRAARLACEMARHLLQQYNFDEILAAISKADAVGALTDPTLYRDKAHLMHEDRKVFEGAKRFLGAWEKNRG